MAYNLVVSRYARALFALASEQKRLDKVAQDLQSLSIAISENGDLRTLVTSPVIDRRDAVKTIQAIAKKGGADDTSIQFLGLLAKNNRLNLVQDINRALVEMIDEAKGNMTATVTVAAPLDQKQHDNLFASLKKMTGASIRMKMVVDNSILGGLVIQIGSKMIDNSVRRRFERLELAMKGTI